MYVYLHRVCVGILLDHFKLRGQNGQILSTELYYIKIVQEVKFQLSLNTRTLNLQLDTNHESYSSFVLISSIWSFRQDLQIVNFFAQTSKNLQIFLLNPIDFFI